MSTQRHLQNAAALLRQCYGATAGGRPRWEVAVSVLTLWQGGYPTGGGGGSTTGLTALEVAMEAARTGHRDVCRHALGKLDDGLRDIVVEVCGLVDAAPQRTAGLSYRHRLHMATAWVGLCARQRESTWTELARVPARRVEAAAATVRDVVVAWAIEPRRPTARSLPANKAQRDEWCRSCLRLGACEPLWLAGPYCRFCREYVRANGGAMPPEHILAKHQRGERITSADLLGRRR